MALCCPPSVARAHNEDVVAGRYLMQFFGTSMRLFFFDGTTCVEFSRNLTRNTAKKYLSSDITEIPYTKQISPCKLDPYAEKADHLARACHMITE